MAEITAQVKEWGKSLGIIIPKKSADREKIRAGDKVRVLLLRQANPLQETFGIAKFSKSTKEILDEVDKEAWDA
ncbi:MAG: hypothetical protein HY394_05970 [Candidatus Diapherotrites archaeon]|nr:hypothetical protein [Candidatus Diapherotrites archaeon]